jgi:hypothetical protein
MQKRIIRIMVGIRNRDSCSEYFKILKILPLKSQYLLSLLLFVADNGDYFTLISEIHTFNTKIKFVSTTLKINSVPEGTILIWN